MRIIKILGAALLGFIALAVTASIGATLWEKWSAAPAEKPVQLPSMQAPPPPQPRRVFDATVDQLIAKYNDGAGSSLHLPTADQFEVVASVPDHYTLMHRFDRGFAVSIEVARLSGRPFSLGFLAEPAEDEARNSRILAAMFTIGAAIYGKGQNAGAVANVCELAGKSNPITAQSQIGGFDVYCGGTAGVLIGGISVPKSQ